MKRNKRHPSEGRTPERYDLIGETDDMEAASSTEQTGLIAAAPSTEYAYESYDEVYDFKHDKGKMV